MSYLHYTHETKCLDELFDRTDRKALANDARIRSMESLAGNYQNTVGLPVPDDLAFTLDELKKRRQSLSTHLDMIAEELNWRDDPQFVIDGYASFGYELVFVCHNRHFDTEAEALSEARFQHHANDVMLMLGPDGSGCDDMVEPEKMVQAVFVKRSID